METGSQNVGVANVVILNTFPPDQAGQAMLTPLLAPFFMFINAGGFIAGYWLQRKYCLNKNRESIINEDEVREMVD